MLDRGREFGQGGLLGRGRNRGRDGRNGGLIALGVSGLAAGIGLASESIKSHRENKARAANQQQVASSSRSISQPDIRVNDIESEGIREEPPPSYSEEDLQQSRSYPVERKVAREIKREMSSHEVSYEEVAGSSREYEEPPPEYGENLEDEWNLDDAQDDEIGDGVYDAPSTEAGKVEDLFIRKHPPPARNSHGSEGLAMPVVIPQRRPKERARGFVRAYAPVLENCGIDQATWMEFLEVFQKSGTANPWLNAINLAQFATMAIPSFGIGLAVGYAIQQATKAAIELDGRAKTNMFMTKLNNEFFRPRGLYALVMTWNPNSDQAIQHVNLTQTIASRNTQNSGLSGIHDRYRTSDGVTQSDWEFPEVAPLIFPALDALATQASRGSATPSKIAGAKAVVGDYFDRRATAAYAKAHPNNMLVQGPAPKFNSRYADPNSPAASGSLISFVSGGKLVPNPESRGIVGAVFSVAGQAVRGEKQGSGWERMEAQKQQNIEMYGTATPEYPDRYSRYYGGRYGTTTLDYPDRYSRYYGGRYGGVGRMGVGFGSPLGVLTAPLAKGRKLLKQDVLYLMVVNMPTEEEMAAARTMK